jgi:predicted amidohydrolase
MFMSTVTVAAIQAKPTVGDFDALRAGDDAPHAVELLRNAKEAGADIACLPEMYPLGGEEAVRDAARELGMWVVAGLAKEVGGGHWHNTATFISDTGEVVGRQPKCYPTANEVASGVVAGRDYEVFETPLGRLGAVICADFAFANRGVAELCRQRVDVIFNPSWWFALGEAYKSSVIGRHLEYGVPVIGVDIAAVALTRDVDGERKRLFPPAGGFTTVAVTPPVDTLDGLGDWFRSKAGGSNTNDGYIQSLGEDEGMLVVDIDVEAVRRFPGYWYSEDAPATHEVNIGATP